MKSLWKSIKRLPDQRWWRSLPFIIPLAVVVIMAWTILQVISYPYDGIAYIHPTGLIKEIDLTGPALDKLMPGDIVTSIDGLPWADFTRYDGKRGGDRVEYIVKRGESEFPVTFNLADQSVSNIIISLAPMFIALIFLGMGLGVLTFKPSDGAAFLFFLWCQACALIFTAGVASYLGPVWTTMLFASMLWIIGPLSAHFHMCFPQSVQFTGRRILLGFLYVVALIGVTPYLMWGPVGLRSKPWYPQLISTSRLFLGVNLILVVVLLFLNYRRADFPGAKAKVRLVMLGGGIAAIPFVFLTVIPEALLQRPIIPYQFMFFWLGILPLTYGYAIFRLHLIEIERHINRGATFILVYSLLGGFYLILSYVLGHFLSANLANTPFMNTVVVLVLASLFFPLNIHIQRFVDRMFYGGWYDYRLGLLQITQGLEMITELHLLARTLAQRLVDTFRLEETCVFLSSTSGEFSVIEVASRIDLGEEPHRSYPVLPRSSLTYLLKIGVIERKNLQKILSQATLTPEELELLNSEQIHLWVPVIEHARVLGLLALGPKLGGDVFSSEDLDILRSVVLQIGPMIENIYLYTRLKEHAEVLEQRVNERTAELHDAKEHVEAILGSVGDGVIVTDLERRITTVNPAFEKQSGYSAAEIVGRNFVFLLAEDNDPVKLEEMQDTLIRGEVWSGELLNRHKDGRPYNVQFTIAPVCDQERQIVSYVGSQRDITRQKELDRMKDVFIADVSHELRTPITNIELYLQLFEDAPPEKRQRYISVVKEQSLLLNKMVEDILDLSRLARVKSKRIEFSELDLNLLVEQVITAHQPMAAASNIELVFEPYRDLHLLWGDQNQIARMISNLVTNAVHYTPEGSVWVRIKEIADQICLEVQDTGVGIEAEDLDHIFERFYRGKNVRQSQIHGTGLGLAIVKEIVDLHNGSIEVQSTSGVGSVFKIWLPIREVAP